jgi:hypothetical protein
MAGDRSLSRGGAFKRGALIAKPIARGACMSKLERVIDPR